MKMQVFYHKMSALFNERLLKPRVKCWTQQPFSQNCSSILLQIYPLQKVQALASNHFIPTVNLCRWIIDQINHIFDFGVKTMFTDEAFFTRSGIWNFHNVHNGADESSQSTRQMSVTCQLLEKCTKSFIIKPTFSFQLVFSTFFFLISKNLCE